MFLPTMTDAEIRQEAKKDYFELGTKIRLAFDTFARRHCNLCNNSNAIFNDRPVSLINRNVESKTWRTRRKNIWYTRFDFTNHGFYNAEAACYIYTPVRRDRGTEYIFLDNWNNFMVERFTLHFIERYKERHLQAHGIDVGTMPTPLYFQLHNRDCIMGCYYKTTDIGVEEGKYKKFWIAPEGIYVTDYIEGMRTYITFMDKEGLSLLKRQVYEEEQVWNVLLRILDEKLEEDLRHRACFELIHNENSCEIVERFLHRNYKGNKDIERSMALFKEQWPKLLEASRKAQEEIERRERKEMREKRQTGKIPSREPQDGLPPLT